MQREADGWNRTGDRGILPVLDDACNLLLRTESEQTVKYDGTTGEFPSFTTSSGVYEYDAASDVWRIAEVLIPYPLSTEYGIYYEQLYGQLNNLQKPFEERGYGGRKYMRIQQVQTVDQVRSTATAFTNAKILFRIDPGDYTYYYRGYKKPANISSENVQLPLPEHLHPYIYEAAILLIKGYQNGTISEAMEKITDELRPIISKEQSEGEQGASSFVKVRPM